MTVPEWARDKVADAVRKLTDLGFTIHATRGTKEFLDGQGVSSELVLKLQEGRPNIGSLVIPVKSISRINQVN